MRRLLPALLLMGCVHAAPPAVVTPVTCEPPDAGDAIVSGPKAFYLHGDIDPEVRDLFRGWLKYAGPEPEVVINSPGGQMESSVEIYQMIVAHGHVTCTVEGAAASGAFGILQGCAVRRMTPKSRLGTHEPSIVGGRMDRVDAAKFLIALDMTTAFWDALCSKRLKLTAEQYEAKVRGMAWIMGAKEALLVGAVDEIVTLP